MTQPKHAKALGTVASRFPALPPPSAHSIPATTGLHRLGHCDRRGRVLRLWSVTAGRGS